MLRKLFVLFGMVIFVLCLVRAEAREDTKTTDGKLFTKHFNTSLFAITSKGHFSIEILLDDSEYPIGKNTVGVVVHNDMDKDVAGASLKIILIDPEKGEHAVPGSAIDDKANGLYIVTGLDLELEGQMELSIEITVDGITDNVQFQFPEVTEDINPKGKYSS